MQPFWGELLNPTPVEIAQVQADFGKEVAARLYSAINAQNHSKEAWPVGVRAPHTATTSSVKRVIDDASRKSEFTATERGPRIALSCTGHGFGIDRL
jgi:hypothetical protein